MYIILHSLTRETIITINVDFINEYYYYLSFSIIYADKIRRFIDISIHYIIHFNDNNHIETAHISKYYDCIIQIHLFPEKAKPTLRKHYYFQLFQ